MKGFFKPAQGPKSGAGPWHAPHRKLQPTPPLKRKPSPPPPTFSLLNTGTKLNDVAPFLQYEVPRTGHAPSEKMVNVLVGSQDRNSQYLTPQLFRISTSTLRLSKVLNKYREDTESGLYEDTPIRLPNLDPNAFGLYCEYLSTSTVLFPHRFGISGCGISKWSWQGCWPLINAHILAQIVQDENFNAFTLKLLKENVDCEQCADAETIKFVFTTSCENLKRFVVEQAVDGGITNFLPKNNKHYPLEFLRYAQDLATERFRPRAASARAAQEEAREEDRIDGGHRVEDVTRKLRADPEILALKWLKAVLESAVVTKASENARSIVDKYGVATIDWAVVKAKEIARENEEWRKKNEVRKAKEQQEVHPVTGLRKKVEQSRSPSVAEGRGARAVSTLRVPQSPASMNGGSSTARARGPDVKGYSPSEESTWQITGGECEHILEKAFRNNPPAVQQGLNTRIRD